MGDPIVTIESLIQAVARLPSEVNKISEEQSLELIQGAVEDFYRSAPNKSRAEMDELLQLTQKVLGRVKKLTKLTRHAHEVKDSGPTEELRWFSKELDTYVANVQKEREANLEEL